MAKASATAVIKSKQMAPVKITDKEQALKTALAGIEKQFGAMAVMRMGERKGMAIESISTGLFTLDLALGVGGLPKGRIAEIFGPESSGKTTVALLCVAEAQKAGGTCVFIDAEHTLDPEYAKRLGVDVGELYVSQPDNGEQALKIAEEFARSGAVDMIVVDSVAALVPRAEIEGEMGDNHVGLQAQLMSQGLRMLAGVVSQSKTVLIFINQLREKIGNPNGGPNEVTTGGKALKFYASVRLDVRRKAPVKGGKDGEDGEDVVVCPTKIKVVKNKVAPPFRFTMVDMVPGRGFNKTGAVVNLAVNQNLIRKSASWYYYGNQKAQGMSGICQFFAEHSDLYKELKEKLRARPDTEATGEESTVAEEGAAAPIADLSAEDNLEDEFDFDDLLAPDPDDEAGE